MNLSSRRLRRYGGLRGIEAIRAEQFRRLSVLINSGIDEATRDLVKAAAEFLHGNERRVLNAAPWSLPWAIETWAEAFGWEEPRGAARSGK